METTVRYLGGKSRLGKKIAAVINPLLTGGAPYYEPFCGACSVARHIKADWRLLSDANEPLIRMWQAVQKGWAPPATVSEAEYAAAKRGELSPELTAFIGFGCSFGGKWFGGYARDSRGDDYPGQAKSSIQKIAPSLASAHFDMTDYRRLVPRPNSVIYCDPPYANTTGYGSVGAFDSAEFWDWVRGRGSAGHIVIVSEYAAPEDFACVAEFATKLEMRDKGGRSPRIERLFTHATSRNLQEVPKV